MELHRIKIEEVWYNRFTMTPNRWKKDFNAIGIIPSSGKYSKGTYAHPDIAFEFASWLSVEFKLYLIKEFDGIIGTGDGPEFTSSDYASHGFYELEFILIKDIVDGKINLLPSKIKEQIINEYK